MKDRAETFCKILIPFVYLIRCPLGQATKNVVASYSFSPFFKCDNLFIEGFVAALFQRFVSAAAHEEMIAEGTDEHLSVILQLLIIYARPIDKCILPFWHKRLGFVFVVAADWCIFR